MENRMENYMGTTDDFLTDLIDRRRPGSEGGNPHRFVELYGGEAVEVTAFEPDPVTYRTDYYYNSIRNVLYRRVVVDNTIGNKVAFWQPASQSR
jgi:hypothetical protein